MAGVLQPAPGQRLLPDVPRHLRDVVRLSLAPRRDHREHAVVARCRGAEAEPRAVPQGVQAPNGGRLVGILRRVPSCRWRRVRGAGQRYAGTGTEAEVRYAEACRARPRQEGVRHALERVDERHRSR